MFSILDPVRIVILGDAKSGKSSLAWRISSSHGSLIGELEPLPLTLPSTVKEFTIESPSPEDNQDLIIIDTESGNPPALREKILEASVAVFCISRNQAQQIQSLESVWVPYLLTTRAAKPMALVVCVTMTDLKDTPSCKIDSIQWEALITEAIGRIQSVCKNSIWVLLDECSALCNDHVTEVFQRAHDTVTDPVFPLMDLETKILRELCVQALEHVFAVCDADKDGLLSKEELIGFQKVVFGTDLPDHTLELILSLLSERVIGGLSADRKITLQGFLYLQRYFAETGDTHAIWGAVRHFGYDNQLNFCPQLDWTPRIQVDRVNMETRDASEYDSAKWSVSSNAGSTLASQDLASSSSYVRVGSVKDDSPESQLLDASFMLLDHSRLSINTPAQEPSTMALLHQSGSDSDLPPSATRTAVPVLASTTSSSTAASQSPTPTPTRNKIITQTTTITTTTSPSTSTPSVPLSVATQFEVPRPQPTTPRSDLASVAGKSSSSSKGASSSPASSIGVANFPWAAAAGAAAVCVIGIGLYAFLRPRHPTTSKR